MNNTSNEKDAAREPRESMATTVACLARALDGLSPGDLAELRRMDPEDPGCPGFWKVVVSDLEPAGVLPAGGPLLDQAERRWAAVLQAMAIAHGFHQPGARLGAALAEAGFSELRFTRLLRARDNGLHDGVRLAARFLAAKGQVADFRGIADLVLSEGRPYSEDVRRRIARDYYRTLQQSQR
jgi:CRISPR system Cascade subunit CasB